MRHWLRNLIVILCIAVISAAIAAALLRYQLVDLHDSFALGLIGFAILLVLHNNISLQRHFSDVERHIKGAHQFEQDMAGRIRQLEIHNAPQAQSSDELQIAIGAAHEVGERPTSKSKGANGLLAELAGNRTVKQTDAKLAPASDNIIALNVHKERNELSGSENLERKDKSYKIKPSQLTKALENGGTELFLQPILELPSRDIRYFEAFVRLRIGDNILTAKQFLPTAINSGKIAQIDLLSLALSFKVVRGLDRQNNDYPVFWNIAPQTLGNKSVFKELLEQMRANQPLNRQLICEISHADYASLSTLQSDNLARIRDLGYELSLDKANPRIFGIESTLAIIKNGMFSVIKVPAIELSRISENDISTYASIILPQANKYNTVVIASDVESDALSVAMIDADVYLAQGNALMPAKALKKELGGS